MSALVSILVPVAAVVAAMSAGITFIFSNTIMAALARRGAEEGAAAMVAINEVILNPAFFAIFLGPGLLLTAVAIGAWADGHGARLALALGAAVYVLGVVLVTIAVNVPLNDALAAQTPGTAAAIDLWEHYLVRWTRWNSVRAVAGAASALFFAFAAKGG
jgi:uncharacterized membrane protein